MSKQINVDLKPILKAVFIIVIIFIVLKFWYLGIPALAVWYLYKKDKKFSRKNKLIFSISISILFILLGIISIRSGRAPSLTILEPNNNTTVQSDQIIIKGKVSPSRSKVTINNLSVEVVNGGNFSFNAKLKNENNSIIIEALNNNKKDSKTISIKRIFTQEELEEINKQKEELQKAEISKIKDRIQKEIDSLDKPFDSTTYRKDNLSLQLEVALFSGYAKIINQYKSNTDPEIKSLLSKFEKKVSQLQINEFPKIRKAYAGFLADTMWENNIEIEAGGSSNKTITFTGSIYANNKNIADSHSIVLENLKTLRFTRANYKWFKYDEEYTYYKIDSYPDSKVTE